MVSNYNWQTHNSTTILPATNATVMHNLTNDHETTLSRQLSNYTVTRIIGNIQCEVPASTAAGRAYQVRMGIAVLENDAVAAGVLPEPYADSVKWLWTWGAKLYAGDNPPASYASPAEPHHLSNPWLDITQKRRVNGAHYSLVLVGWHDNGLGANPSAVITLRSLFSIRV